MSRETFLERVRTAAAAGRAYRVQVQSIPSGTGYIGAGDDPAGRLIAEIIGVGGEASEAADLDAARAQLVSLLEKYRPHSALCWQHPLLDKVGLASVLKTAGVEQLSFDLLSPLPQEDQRTRMLAADICISSVRFAVAETGTLVVASAPGRERCGSLLAPVHVALVERVQILPDLFDLFARLEDAGPDAMASNITLITGPSKSGDIELQLTTGVHGPGRLHVIVIR